MSIFGLFSRGANPEPNQNENENKKSGSIQNPTLKNQINKLRTQIDKNKEAGKTQREKYEELLHLNNIVTEGYRHNLNVIIEISQLLMDYRMFVEEIANSMQDMTMNASGGDNGNASLTNLVTVDDLSHLKELTSDKLLTVAKDFEKQIDQIKKVSQENGKETAELENAQRILNKLADDKTQTAIKSQMSQNGQIGGGRGRGRGRGKGRGRGSGGGRGEGQGRDLSYKGDKEVKKKKA